MSTSYVLRRAAAVLAATALVATTTATSAHAAVDTFHDKAGDSLKDRGRLGDIRKVRVKHGPEAVRLTVTHSRRGSNTDVYLAWVDTDPARRGPEFLVGAYAEVPGAVGVAVAEGFMREPEQEVPCLPAYARWKNGPGEPVKIVVPRRCLGDPERIRVSVASEPDYPYQRIDWAPGKGRYGPWVVTG